jgi:hypothetical protein
MIIYIFIKFTVAILAQGKGMSLAAPLLPAAFDQTPPCGWGGMSSGTPRLCKECGEHGVSKNPHAERYRPCEPNGLNETDGVLSLALACPGSCGSCGMCRYHCIIVRLLYIYNFVRGKVDDSQFLDVLGHSDGVETILKTLSTIRDATDIPGMIQRHNFKVALRKKMRKVRHLLEGSLNKKNMEKKE